MTKTFPLVSIARKIGALNVAKMPDPSTELAVPDPANVVTTPKATITILHKTNMNI